MAERTPQGLGAALLTQAMDSGRSLLDWKIPQGPEDSDLLGPDASGSGRFGLGWPGRLHLICFEWNSAGGPNAPALLLRRGGSGHRDSRIPAVAQPPEHVIALLLGVESPRPCPHGRIASPAWLGALRAADSERRARLSPGPSRIFGKVKA